MASELRQGEGGSSRVARRAWGSCCRARERTEGGQVARGRAARLAGQARHWLHFQVGTLTSGSTSFHLSLNPSTQPATFTLWQGQASPQDRRNHAVVARLRQRLAHHGGCSGAGRQEAAQPPLIARALKKKAAGVGCSTSGSIHPEPRHAARHGQRTHCPSPVPIVMHCSRPSSGGRVPVSCSSSASSAATPPAGMVARGTGCGLSLWHSGHSCRALTKQHKPAPESTPQSRLTPQAVSCDEDGPAGAPLGRLTQRLLRGAVDVGGGSKDALHTMKGYAATIRLGCRQGEHGMMPLWRSQAAAHSPSCCLSLLVPAPLHTWCTQPSVPPMVTSMGAAARSDKRSPTCSEPLQQQHVGWARWQEVRTGSRASDGMPQGSGNLPLLPGTTTACTPSWRHPASLAARRASATARSLEAGSAAPDAQHHALVGAV